MENLIKVGLKANAAFLFPEMRGDTMGGSEGGVYWRSIVHLTTVQFAKFKKLIITFGGDLDKSLTQTLVSSFCDEVDYECYFIKAK